MRSRGEAPVLEFGEAPFELVDTRPENGELCLETDLALGAASNTRRTRRPFHHCVEGYEALRAVRAIHDP